MIEIQNIMEELINLVAQKTGFSQEDSRKAVEAVISALKAKLPGPIAAHLDSYLSGDGGLGALEAQAGEMLKGKLGSLFGGNG